MTRASIELGDVTPHNIKQLKKLNNVVFPVSYNDKFYIDVLEAGELAKLAYYNDIVVGAVCCRIDTSENQRRLYIMTLGCLYPYRRLGIGTVMFNHILSYVEKDGNFDSIFLHVQINNEGAIEFYKKFGFEIVETKEHYYKRIEPADAHVLQKTLRKKNTSSSSNNYNINSNMNNNNCNNSSNNLNNSSILSTSSASSSSSSSSSGLNTGVGVGGQQQQLQQQNSQNQNSTMNGHHEKSTGATINHQHHSNKSKA